MEDRLGMPEPAEIEIVFGLLQSVPLTSSYPTWISGCHRV